MQTSHGVNREGLMSDFSEFKVGRHQQLIETRRAAIELIDGCG